MEFASFGEDFDKSVGGKVLKLVYIEVEVGTVGDVLKDAVHGRELNLSDQHGA